MKTKTWRNGTTQCRSYIKAAGNGFEVGFYSGSKLLFVGNFIHSNEATKWYTAMNKEIRTFGHRFRVAKTYSPTFMWRLLSNHLYRRYYQFLDTCFSRYNRNFQRAVTRDIRQYKNTKRHTYGRPTVPFLRAA